MAHEFPIALHSLCDDLWVFVADVGIERDGSPDPVLIEHVHDAVDADASTIIALRPGEHVGADAVTEGHGLVEREELDVG